MTRIHTSVIHSGNGDSAVRAALKDQPVVDRFGQGVEFIARYLAGQRIGDGLIVSVENETLSCLAKRKAVVYWSKLVTY